MRYSLLNRFQSTLLGSILGEQWGLCSQYGSPDDSQDNSQGDSQNVLAGAAGALTPGASLRLPPKILADLPRWGRLAVEVTRTLSHTSDPDWTAIALRKTLVGSPTHATDLALGLSVGLLPLALFYHDDPEQWRSQMHRLLTSWQLPATLGTMATISGSIVRWILQEQPQPFPTLEQILTDSNPMEVEPSWNAALNHLQNALVQGKSLETMLRGCKPLVSADARTPSPLPFCLVLYCFLTTPQDFSLTLLRTARPGFPVHLMAALAGAISGCQNGTAGIPLRWKQQLHPPHVPESWVEPGWGLGSETDLQRLTESLWHRWTGGYGAASPYGMPLAIAAALSP